MIWYDMIETCLKFKILGILIIIKTSNIVSNFNSNN